MRRWGGLLLALWLWGWATPSSAFFCYVANDVVPYNGYFHDDTGTLVDPTSPTANVRITPFAGTATYTALTAPTKLNAETGRYGGEYTIGASPTLGTYEIAMKGTVPTSKTVGAVVVIFQVRAACPLAPTVAGRTLDVAVGGEAGVDFSNISGTLDTAEIGADAKQQLGFCCTITASGAGNTTTIIESSSLTATVNKSYIGMRVNCPAATNTDNRSINLKIAAFDPATDRITLNGALAAALTVGDVCNLQYDTLR